MKANTPTWEHPPTIPVKELRLMLKSAETTAPRKNVCLPRIEAVSSKMSLNHFSVFVSRTAGRRIWITDLGTNVVQFFANEASLNSSTKTWISKNR